MFTKTTRDIKVTVVPHYLSQHSDARESHFVWAYTVQLENLGDETVQLQDRHWLITDDQGRQQEVRGEGVVGEQPRLKPGMQYQYTSGTYLPTPSGVMRGTYGMKAEDGEDFRVEIPLFSLDSPDVARRAN